MNEYKLLTYTVNWSPTRVAGAFGAKICGERENLRQTFHLPRNYGGGYPVLQNTERCADLIEKPKPKSILPANHNERK